MHRLHIADKPNLAFDFSAGRIYNRRMDKRDDSSRKAQSIILWVFLWFVGLIMFWKFYELKSELVCFGLAVILVVSFIVGLIKFLAWIIRKAG